MAAPGTVWADDTWDVDAWADNTWADAEAPPESLAPYSAEISVTSRTPSMSVSSRRPTITVGDA